MKTLQYFLAVGCIFSSGLLLAQQDKPQLYSLTTASHRAGVSFLQLHDPYLSSLTYTGMGVRLELLEQRFFDPSDGRFSMLTRLTGMMAATKNPASTASVNYAGGNLTWGVQYHYRKLDNWVLLAGAAAEAEFGAKMNTRNINNPANMDIALNLNALLGARYFLQTAKRTLQFSGSYESPLVGGMFVPYPGLSYYELYTSKRISEALFFSSLHNRQGNKLSVTIDFPMRYSTLHFGWRYHHLKYRGSGPVFTLDEHSLLLGITYDIFRSSGRMSHFPSNYIRSMK